jgi:hypothetical protein
LDFKHAKTIAKFIMLSIAGAIATKFIDQVWLFLTDLGNKSDLHFEEWQAIVGIIALVISGAIGLQLILHFKSCREKQKLTKNITLEDILDDLINEIELFIKNWERGIPLLTGGGYRGEIESKAMWRNRKKIRRHATEIRKKTNSLRNQITGIETDVISQINENLDRMVVFGLEVEEIFELQETIQQSLKLDPNKMERLVSEGDSITQEFKRHIAGLEKLRRHLP